MEDLDTNAVSRYSEADFDAKLVSVSDAAAAIQSSDHIWVAGITSTPSEFLEELSKHRDRLRDVRVIGGMLPAFFDFMKADFRGHIGYECFFFGPAERAAQKGRNIDLHPYHLSEVPEALRTVHKPNVCALHVTEPDENGFMNLGPCGGIGSNAALECSDRIIACVNPALPWTNGPHNQIHVSQVTHITRTDAPLVLMPERPSTEIADRIADYIVPLVQDGDTLQIGIGEITDTVGYRLADKRDLGVHTELLTDCLVDLAKRGAINGTRKNFMPNKMVFGFAAGSQKLMDYINGNDTDAELYPVDFVNDSRVVGKNDNFVSINTCLMIDLTGQVASEAVGHTQISAIGGQVEFVRGAKYSDGGRSFIAVASTRKVGDTVQSTIVPDLPIGTAVTTARVDVQYLVTEYGIADMRFKSQAQRARAVIELAHPDFRDGLREEARKQGLFQD